MFLRFLEKEEEKEAFLELAHLLIPMDEKFTEEEKRMLEEFKWELRLNKEFTPYEIKDWSEMEGFLGLLSRNNKRLLAGLLIELIALAKSNNIYSEKEQEFLNYVAEYWGVSEKLKEFEKWVDEYFKLLKDLERVLSTED
jgi:hypothetical protein